MPHYEVSLVFRHGLSRPQLVEAVKRAGKKIFDAGGFIRKVESLGERSLPQKQVVGDVFHSRGHYFLFRMDVPVGQVQPMLDEYQRDTDILRRNIFNNDIYGDPEEPPPCTLEEEMKPPSERPSIQTMIKIGMRKPAFIQLWDPRTGMSFYPFHR